MKVKKMNKTYLLPSLELCRKDETYKNEKYEKNKIMWIQKKRGQEQIYEGGKRIKVIAFQYRRTYQGKE